MGESIKTPKEWAQKFDNLLTSEEFSEFAEFLDSCDVGEFYEEIAEIDCERNPHLYVDPNKELLNKIVDEQQDMEEPTPVPPEKF